VSLQQVVVGSMIRLRIAPGPKSPLSAAMGVEDDMASQGNLLQGQVLEQVAAERADSIGQHLLTCQADFRILLQCVRS